MSDSNLKKTFDDPPSARDSNIDNKKKTNKGKNSKKNNNIKANTVNNFNSQGHYRQGQSRRQQNNQFAQNFDLSIQEQLTNGQLKYKGKKSQISINHLLDFNLPQVERTDDNSSHKKKKSHRKKIFQDEHINLSGDSFINVNYRILVKQNGDYQLQDNDPNRVIPDENIVAVMVSKGQNCPICLCEEPIAPRMVTCGHIFCCSCLINFFAIEEPTKNKNSNEQVFTKKKKLKECPLCNNIIRPQRLKNVIFQENSEFFKLADLNAKPKPEDEVTFELMVRPHISMLPLPVRLNVDHKKIGNFPNVSFKEIGKYARVLKCDTSYTLELLNKDIESIKTQYEIDKALFNDDGKYVDLAIEQINALISTILSEDINELDNNLNDLTLKDVQNDVEVTNDGDFKPKSNLNDSNSFFFYQTTFNHSTKYFLSSLDVKILKCIFENYSDFPETIKVKIENIHYDMEITENFVRRYKYMSYLPWGTEVAFIDLDWKNIPFIPTETYQQFTSELKQRSREYKQKKLKEDKLKKIYDAKLEEDTAAFYRNENSDYYPSQESSVDYRSLRNSSLVLDSLSGAKERGVMNNASENDLSLSRKKKNHQTTTIWGTSIDVLTDEKSVKENNEFAEMLMNKMQDGKSQGKKKKKGKVLLFST